jgi:hypothetical protein
MPRSQDSFRRKPAFDSFLVQIQAKSSNALKFLILSHLTLFGSIYPHIFVPLFFSDSGSVAVRIRKGPDFLLCFLVAQPTDLAS